MCSVASFNSRKVHLSHYFRVEGLIDNEILSFLFDTGASYTVVGVNNLFAASPDNSNIDLFRTCLSEEIAIQNIEERANPLRVANKDYIQTFPCVSHNVSVEGTPRIDFYFDLSLDDISLPLLGSSYIDDCAWSNSIKGKIVVTGIADNPGAAAYAGTKVLDFDRVLQKYRDLRA